VSQSGVCAYCGDPVDVSREFVYQIEVQEFQERFGIPVHVLRYFPQPGEPLRICRECWASIEENERESWEERERRRKFLRFYTWFYVVLFGGPILITFIAAIVLFIYEKVRTILLPN
jgi:hypothetical protein